jgi:hypothetical protein
MRDLGPRRRVPTPRFTVHGSISHTPANLGAGGSDRRSTSSARSRAPEADAEAETSFAYPSIAGLARLMAALVSGTDSDPTTFVTRCGWCRRFDVQGQWLDLDDAARNLTIDGNGRAPTITHGICEECVTSFERALDEV